MRFVTSENKKPPQRDASRKYFRKFEDNPWEEIDFTVYLHFWSKGQQNPRIVDGFSYVSMPISLARTLNWI